MQKQTIKDMMPNVRTNEDFPFSLLKNMNFYFEKKIYNKLPQHYYNVYSLIGKDDPDRLRFTEIFE